MPTLNRRTIVAAIGTSLFAGPLRAQGRSATPAGFTGAVLVNESGRIRIHTYLADLNGAMVTSHVIEGPGGLVVVDGQFVRAAALELKQYVDSLGKPVQRLIVSHQHPDHWYGIHHFRRMPVHAGPITAKFLAEGAAKFVAERKADSSAPEIAGVLDQGIETVAGVELRFRHVLDTEAPEIVTIEIPAVGAIIVQDVVYNKVHVVVSRQIDNWIAVLKGIEARGAQSPIILAGHGEPASPASLPGLVQYLEAVKPLLNANAGKPDRAKALTDEIATAFPDYRLPPLLTLGLSRSLQT